MSSWIVAGQQGIRSWSAAAAGSALNWSGLPSGGHGERGGRFGETAPALCADDVRPGRGLGDRDRRAETAGRGGLGTAEHGEAVPGQRYRLARVEAAAGDDDLRARGATGRGYRDQGRREHLGGAARRGVEG